MNFSFDNINFKGMGARIWEGIQSISERTLQLVAIGVLHSAFVPVSLAYVNGLTEKLPSLDVFMLVIGALAILNLRAIVKKDSIAQLIHAIGFIGQLVLFALVLMK